MQPATFARTKIQPPRFRAGLIERGELERRMDAALATCRLVLLIAPAGYGKTAALSRQLQRLPEGCAAAWVTADEEDDLQRFLVCLAESLEPYDPPWRTAPEALASQLARGAGLRAGVDEWLGVLDAIPVARGLIALDDLHTVADIRVFEFLGLLLAGLPENWTLAIASRGDPPLPLARLRARRELAEFRQADLSFNQTEIQLLCGASGADASGEAARRLLDRTQGWAVGVSLSLDAPAGSAAGAPDGRWSQRHLFDYLAAEVFEKMQPELREFLLRCSVLPELSASRCAAVSGNARAAEWLEEIERRGLFVSVLESDELTLRLHDLFRDFLDHRLRRQHADEVPLLLQRAADGERDPVRRMNMLLRAGAWGAAEQTLLDATEGVLAFGESSRIPQLISQFPAEARERSPLLAYAHGLFAWQRYQYMALQAAMHRAASGFDALGRPDDAQRARALEALALFFLGCVEEALRLSQAIRARPMDRETAALSALFDYWHEGYYGTVDGPAEHLGRVVDLLTASGSADLWYRCTPRIYMFIGRPGMGAQLQRFVRGAFLAAGEEHTSLLAAARVTEAFVLMWQGRMAETKAVLEQIMEDSRWLGQPESLRMPLLILQAQYHVIRGDREAVRASCEAIASSTRSSPDAGEMPGRFLPTVVRVSAAVEDWEGVRKTLALMEGDPVRGVRQGQLLFRTFEAQLALHEGRNEEALSLLRELVVLTSRVDRLGLDSTVRTRLALAELRSGAPAAAWRTLAPMVERIAATGEVGEALLSGLHVLAELSLARWGAAASAEGVATLRRWVELGRRLGAELVEAPSSRATPVGARLSAREIEVLQRLAAGDSNKLIARALDLSPHTVKRHVARILDRLDLSSRGEAAAWYQKQRRA